MSTAEIVLTVFAAVFSLAALIVGAAALITLRSIKKKDNGGGDIEDAVGKIVKMETSMLTGAVNAQNENSRAMMSRVEALSADVNEKMNKLNTQTVEQLGELKLAMSENMGTLNVAMAKNIAELKDANALSLKEVREDNAKQLEQVRLTVDEKLSATVEQRFDTSFKQVTERLEAINRSFNELQTLQAGVGDLNRIFKNVKSRGTWGEVSLESLLSQILIAEQYRKQERLVRGSDDAVDFVIKMPGKGEGEVLLPIDAKFPLEDYERLSAAADAADPDGVEAASKALAQRVKKEAQDISNKYIRPPKTTDFAIMYLPTEGLYAEVIRRDGLISDLQTRYRVIVCGPTTLAALLNSLQMGFKSVAMEKRSTEIAKLLKSFNKDFDKLTVFLRQTNVRLAKLKDTFDDAEKRTGYIRNTLDKATAFVGEEPSHELLDAPDAEITFDVEEVAGDSED